MTSNYQANRGTSKYHNVRVESGGLQFDSKAEAARYRELVLLQDAGEISELQHHPKYLLVPGYNKPDGTHVRAIWYEGDAGYIEGGQKVCEDVKGGDPEKGARRGNGTITDIFLLKRKILGWKYPDIDFRIVWY